MTKNKQNEILRIKSEMLQMKNEIDGDIESSHFYADKLLCELLIILGYQDIVDDYESIDKWYS
jgi:hypothetical protein